MNKAALSETNHHTAPDGMSKGERDTIAEKTSERGWSQLSLPGIDPIPRRHAPRAAARSAKRPSAQSTRRTHEQERLPCCSSIIAGS
jgi:hypothetical protein